MKRHPGIFFLLLVVVAVSYFHWNGIRPGFTFLPVDLASKIMPWGDGYLGKLQNWLISDPLYQYYPFLVSQIESVRHGEWLWWASGIYMGHPAIADPLFQSFYPIPVGLGFLFGAARGYAIYLYLHVLLAACFTFLLLRSLKVEFSGSIAGALTYSLSGYLVTWFEFSFWTATLAWLPAILWAFYKGISGKNTGFVALAGIFLGVAILAGQFQFVLVFVGFSLFLMFAYLLKPITIDGYGRKDVLLSFICTVTIGMAIGGLQLWPFQEFLNLSRRQLDTGLRDPLPIQQLASLIMPNFFGNPSLGDYWGSGNYNESTIYTGTVAIFLAIVAIVNTRNYWSYVLAAAFVGLLYFIIGGPGTQYLGGLPIVKYISLHRSSFLLPILVSALIVFVYRAKFISWYALCIASLFIGVCIYYPFVSNWGDAHRYLDNSINQMLYSGLWVVATLILLTIRNLLPSLSSAVNWSLTALIYANLLLWGSNYNPYGSVNHFLELPASVQFLQQQPLVDRVLPLNRMGKLMFIPNLLSSFGLSEPGGYSSLLREPLYRLIAQDDPKVDNPWISRASNIVLFSNPSNRLLDIFNVRYLISPEVLYDPGPKLEFGRKGCIQSKTLDPQTPMSKTFYVANSAINRLDLQFDVHRSEISSATVTLKMWRIVGMQQILEERRPEVEIRGQPLQTFYFSPERNAPGQEYRWELTIDRNSSLGVCANQQGQASLTLYGQEMVEAFRDDKLFIYERLSPFPRASVVYAARKSPNANETINFMLDPSFDLRNILVTESTSNLPSVPLYPATPTRFVNYSNNDLLLEASAKVDGMLVLADQYDPGWQAYVDGQQVPVQIVNGFMRGVPLKSGGHEVEFVYRPRSFLYGVVSASFGFVAALLIMLLPRFSRQRSQR